VTFGFGETVTLLSRTVSGRDADGNDVYTTVETPVPGSVFAPFGSTELIQGQDTTIQNPTIYLGDPTVVPKATDRCAGRMVRCTTSMGCRRCSRRIRSLASGLVLCCGSSG
jgi:hypothetical protein